MALVKWAYGFSAKISWTASLRFVGVHRPLVEGID
jgi:hypothetical protein